MTSCFIYSSTWFSLDNVLFLNRVVPILLFDLNFQTFQCPWILFDLFPLSFFREFSLSMSIEMPYEIINLSSSHRIKTKVINSLWCIVFLKYFKKIEYITVCVSPFRGQTVRQWSARYRDRLWDLKGYRCPSVFLISTCPGCGSRTIRIKIVR